ncbi:MAG: tRNA (adenosine(37)-N6)-threonylcarbamoyltransferase complex dimerization subunit type 1 TsaB [Candidatus Margulisiibacteriota bacterium]
MRILGISSATKIVSVGLVDEQKVLAELTADLMQSENIILYLKEAGILPDQIDGIAVTIGPGSYSGLRGGLTTAKTLAQTLNVPLAAVSTLEAIAYNLVNEDGEIAVVLDARADEYNYALFVASKGAMKRISADEVIKLDDLKAKLLSVNEPMRIAGKVVEFENVMNKNLHFADRSLCDPLGINVAKLGLIKIKAGQTEDVYQLSPKYSHKPNIREFNR